MSTGWLERQLLLTLGSTPRLITTKSHTNITHLGVHAAVVDRWPLVGQGPGALSQQSGIVNGTRGKGAPTSAVCRRGKGKMNEGNKFTPKLVTDLTVQ